MGMLAGNANYLITVATSLTVATAGSETPGATYIKLLAETYDISPANLIKPRPTIAAAVYVPSTKYDITITLKNVTVAPQSATTALAEANAIDHFFYTYSIKRGSSQILYLFIQHLAESSGYRNLDWNGAGTHMRCLRCAVEGFPSSATPSAIIEYSSIKFNKAA